MSKKINIFVINNRAALAECEVRVSSKSVNINYLLIIFLRFHNLIKSVLKTLNIQEPCSFIIFF